MNEFDEMTVEEHLAIVPDNGTLSRRIRRWNISHGYVLTGAVWAAIGVLIIWMLG